MKIKQYVVYGIATLLLLCSLVACDADIDIDVNAPPTNTEENNEQQNAVHTCEYVLQSILEATCTQSGVKIYACACGNERTETIEAVHQTLVEEPKVDATCVEQGRTTRVICTVCNTVVSGGEVIPVTAHTTATEAGVAATCTATGKTDRVYCTVCNTTLSGGEELPKAAHTTATETGVAATCTATGKTDRVYCTVCNETLSGGEELPKAAHTTATEVGFAATCTAVGKTDRVYCTVCNTTLSGGEELPKAAHTTATEAGFAATCTAAGKTDRVYCSVCNATLSGGEELPKAAHTTATETGFAATCTVAGKTDRVYCTVCHVTVSGGEVIPPAHTIATQVGFGATCTTVGKTDRTYCSVCSATISGGEEIPVVAHTVATQTGYAATCTTTGKTDRTYCSVCNTTLSGGEEIPITHVVATEKGYAATCTTAGRTDRNYCTLCSVTLSGGETIAAKGHREVILPATAATDSSPAKTQGKRCSVCDIVIVAQTFVFANDYKNPARYASDYAYKDLAKHDHGAQMQAFYRVIGEQADAFHSSRDDAKKDGVIGSGLDYVTCGLTQAQALEVWAAYRLDHPLYYWLSATVGSNDTKLFLIADQEYRTGKEREKINKRIYDKAEELIKNATEGTSTYHILLSLHDQLILNADYAYDPNGTPSKAVYAHNVIGVLLEGRGVCESYSESFQMLLNYCGIPNVIVTGVAGESRVAHEWNLVMLDDGKWYWFDVTWDDTPNFAWGISYTYFCKENATGGFESSHVRDVHAGGDEVGYLYELPTRATTPFDVEDLVLFDCFMVDGMTYALVGYGKVQLAAIVKEGAIDIPQRVKYQGTEYTVISIGAISSGNFSLGPIAYVERQGFAAPLNITSIKIPDSVLFIWDYAFDINALGAFEVAPGNKYFSTRDGVLFNKDKTVLIKYPTGKIGTSYTVPDSVKWIAVGAFRDFYVNGKLSLETIRLGNKTEAFCIFNKGYGYKDNVTNRTAEEWDAVIGYLSGDAIIYRSNGTVFKKK